MKEPKDKIIPHVDSRVQQELQQPDQMKTKPICQ